MKYLAPYVYRVAICDNRIHSVDEQGVTYRVKPSGFHKLRYYGFMSSSCKQQLADVRWLVWLWRGWTYYLASQITPPVVKRRKPPKCDRCGGELELVGITDSQGKWIWCRRLPARGPPAAPQVAPHGKISMT